MKVIHIILLIIVLISSIYIIKVNHKVAKEKLGQLGDEASNAFLYGIGNVFIIIVLILMCLFAKK
jgi:regulator of protease activity HflC (stomatin/prohibitin superfamily)